MQKIIVIQPGFNENDIRNLYWPGLYNVKFVPDCSGSMLVEINELRAYLTNISTSDRPAVTRIENFIAVKSYIRHKQLFSCLDRKSK